MEGGSCAQVSEPVTTGRSEGLPHAAAIKLILGMGACNKQYGAVIFVRQVAKPGLRGIEDGVRVSVDWCSDNRWDVRGDCDAMERPAWATVGIRRPRNEKTRQKTGFSVVSKASTAAFVTMFGSATRTRTWDPMINSHLLYRLSYRGICGVCY